MHLKYPIYPVPETGEKFIDFDTDNPDLKQRADWAKDRLGASGWAITTRLSQYGNYPDSLGTPGTVLFVSADVEFYGFPYNDGQPEGRLSYTCDALALLHNPELTVANIAMACNIKLDLGSLKFVDPDDTKPPVPDWEAADSPVGPPMASLPGYFSQNFKVKQPDYGGVWTGPSGARYQLVRWKSGGAFSFGSLTVWQVLT